MAGKIPGPAPKAPKLKAIQGGRLTLLQRRAGGGVDLPAELPEAPASLSDIARAEWAEVVPSLDAAGLLSRVDGRALAMYCHNVAEHEWAAATLEAEGRVNELESGFLQVHPAVGIGHRAREQAYRFLTEFGMTPSSRSRVVASPKPKEPSRWKDSR